MKRWDLLNWLIENRCGGSEACRYLEIGCRHDQCFKRVACRHKTGIDPERGGTIRATSDEFFTMLDQDPATFDLVLVDGLHHASQVYRDVENSLRHLSARGVIVLHDCLPQTKRAQDILRRDGSLITSPPDGNPWNGDVWKAMAAIRARADLDSATLDADHGLGVIIDRENTDQRHVPGLGLAYETLTWEDYRDNRAELMRVMNWAGLWEWISQAT